MNVATVGRCTVLGCQELGYSRGLCRAHYERLRKHGAVGSAQRLKRHWGEGNLRPDGYTKVNRPSHPLAARDGRVYLHRMALYDRIGPGTHPCYWCGKPVSWRAQPWSKALVVDHADYDRQNDAPDNLVASCHSCNSGRTRRWLRN